MTVVDRSSMQASASPLPSPTVRRKGGKGISSFKLAVIGFVSIFCLAYLSAVRYFFMDSSSSITTTTTPSDHQKLRVLPTQKDQTPADGVGDTLGCLTEDCIRVEAAKVARAYALKRDRSQWCLHNNPNLHHTDDEAGDITKDKDGRHQGILLVKVPKAASSTSAGIALRLSHRLQCDALQWMHRLAVEYAPHTKRNTVSSFVFSSIRDPAQRAVSSIFFHVLSRDDSLQPTDDTIIGYLKRSKASHYGARSDGQGGFQLRYLAFEDIPVHSAWLESDPTSVINPQFVVDTVRKTMNGYDFILITERMDESLVAMALLMGLDVGDVLVTSSKVAGSYYHLVKPAGSDLICLSTLKSFISPAVAAYLESEEWRAANYGDYLLYQAANQSLDRTIETVLGRKRFDAALAEFQRLKQREEKLCAPHVNFPCDNQGKPQPALAKQNCYLRNYDFGCGYPCIDHMVDSEARINFTLPEYD